MFQKFAQQVYISLSFPVIEAICLKKPTFSWVLVIFKLLKTSATNSFFTITAEIHARSLANFYCQYADRHMNLKFMRRVSERERTIRQYVIVKNKLTSVFYASVLLTMNFVITLSK